ncbi:NTF2 fold immunity protein [Chryseobacterium sp. AG363]|uniref:NTF2 fold immunity protein n=1 Tax=Chryseobacterium sp. AG363 TaxID=2183997 RepID=UPI000E7335DD|nr:NTF2 fold immunity protein [Chryseobacterium sp. AG363]RKE82578.1 NTF2 fold immunity protein of polymorphic toxin system component [Chryseobacterium sp. AG363]
MKYCILIALISVTSCKKSNTYKGKKTLTDKEIAISIAERKWKQVYGKSAINQQKPFVTEKKNDSIRIVQGTLPKNKLGGVAYAEVNVKTKKVISFTHGK